MSPGGFAAGQVEDEVWYVEREGQLWDRQWDKKQMDLHHFTVDTVCLGALTVGGALGRVTPPLGPKAWQSLGSLLGATHHGA